MSEQDTEIALLREIRDNQREALALQREHIQMYQRQLDRVEKINDRAEAIQGRAGKAMKFILWLAVPLVALLLLLMLWPYLRAVVA